MKRFFAISLGILLFYASVSSQETFSTIINNDKDLYCTDIFETSSGNYIVTSIGIVYGSKASIATHLYRVNNVGIVLDSLIISEDRNCLLKKTMELENGDFISWGSYETEASNVYDFWQVIFDNELNIVSQSFYEIPNGHQVLKINSIIRENNNIALSVTFRSDANNSSMTDFFMAEINQNGERVSDSIFNQGNRNFVYDMDYVFTNNTYYLATLNEFTAKAESEILVMDSNFNVIDEYPTYQTKIRLGQTINFINDSMFLFAGNYRPSKKVDNQLLGIYKYDTSFVELDHLYIGTPDTLMYSGVFNNLDFTNSSNIFFGSTKNFLYNANQWTSQKSWIQIDNVDSDLNISWEKYYGGDAYYFLYYTLATADGGALFMASKYEHGESGPYERDIFLLKVNQDGLITSVPNDLQISIKDAIVLPNPGRDYLELHTAAFPANFILLDMNGKIVLQQSITQNKSQMNTQSLATGAYVWRLIKRGALLESGKWIKE